VEFEFFQDKDNRDARFRELRSQGYDVRRSSIKTSNCIQCMSRTMRGYSDDDIRDEVSKHCFGPTIQSEITIPRLEAAGYGVVGAGEKGLECIRLDGPVSKEDFNKFRR